VDIHGGFIGVAVWLSGNVVGQINEVSLHRAGLMLRWMTVRGYTVLVFNQATQVNTAWWVDEMSTSDGYGCR